MHLHYRVILWLFLLGALLGTILDALQVYAGIEHYAAPIWFGQAWWVPLLFGSAAMAIGYSHSQVDHLLAHRPMPHSLLASTGELTWLVLAYLITLIPIYSLAKVGLLLLVYLNFWLLAGRSWQNLLLSFVTAITGTLIEMILIAAGAFSYAHADMLGVPFWLPCLYAIASLAVGDLGRSLLSLNSRGVS